MFSLFSSWYFTSFTLEKCRGIIKSRYNVIVIINALFHGLKRSQGQKQLQTSLCSFQIQIIMIKLQPNIFFNNESIGTDTNNSLRIADVQQFCIVTHNFPKTYDALLLHI